jgi:hypothetical protein
MDGDTWHSYRFVTESDGSPAFMLEPPDRPKCREALTGAGFTQISSYFSARVPCRRPQAHRAGRHRSAFTVEPWDGTEPEALFEQVYALSTEAFSRNAFYKPITRDAFLAMYMPLVPMLKRADLLRPPPGRDPGRDSCSASRTTPRARRRERRS